MFHVPNQFRIRSGRAGSTDDYGNNGAFLLPKVRTFTLFAIASDGLGWEHVSVSVRGAPRAPTWDEMCAVKARFWDEDDTVLQFHPPKSAYVNFHPYCLHLWRPVGADIALPPTWMVGPRPGQSVADCRAEEDAAWAAMERQR